MTRTASAKLSVYARASALAFAVGLLLGRPEIVVLATPFLLAATLGLALARKPAIEVESRLDRDRVLEEEEVTATVTLSSEAPVDRLELVVRLPAALELVDGTNPVALRLLPREPRNVELRLRCTRWGAYGIGEAVFRAGDRLGFFVWEGGGGETQALRVYPRAEKLRALVPPLETQSFAGNQVSRAKGEGIEFADIRPFVAGDRVRRINWRASARRTDLVVNEHHPERNADVVLLIDTFAQARGESTGTLDLAVRAAVSLASPYLRRKDRVGIVSFGGVLSWLKPGAGRLQLYRIVESMLEADIVFTYVAHGVQTVPPRALPPKALLLALTPLVDSRSTATLLDLRRRGFDVVAIEISPLPFVRTPRNDVEELAQRLWALERETLRDDCVRGGIPVVEWRDRVPLDVPLEEVRGFRRQARPVRA